MIRKIWNKLLGFILGYLFPLPKFKPIYRDLEPEVSKEDRIPEEIVWQSLLMDDDEVLVYKDHNGESHIFSKRPLDKNSKYKILYLDPEILSSMGIRQPTNGSQSNP